MNNDIKLHCGCVFKILIIDMGQFIILGMYWVYVHEIEYWAYIGHMIANMMIGDDF